MEGGLPGKTKKKKTSHIHPVAKGGGSRGDRKRKKRYRSRGCKGGEVGKGGGGEIWCEKQDEGQRWGGGGNSTRPEVRGGGGRRKF